ncbi:MAG: Spy/CpxP family protein refolding chaperone [Planctomycetota bacterium]|jgi:hypothetical protein
MKQHLIWLILALSLLFNLFFTVGFMQARAQVRAADSTEDVSHVVTRELNLDDAQAAVFADLRSSMRDDVAVYDDAIALSRQDLVEELGREEPDLGRVRGIVERNADLHQQRRLAGARRFSEFLGILSPQQCRLLSAKVHGGPRGKGRRFLLKRFDADRDGMLNDEERAAAHEFIEARRQEREKRRGELFERFDANQDGRLDPQERSALQEWMMEHRGRGGDGERPRRKEWPEGRRD